MIAWFQICFFGNIVHKQCTYAQKQNCTIQGNAKKAKTKRVYFYKLLAELKTNLLRFLNSLLKFPYFLRFMFHVTSQAIQIDFFWRKLIGSCYFLAFLLTYRYYCALKWMIVVWSRLVYQVSNLSLNSNIWHWYLQMYVWDFVPWKHLTLRYC
jgi:hypothetical protein